MVVLEATILIAGVTGELTLIVIALELAVG
jgi:hypothetical protein